MNDEAIGARYKFGRKLSEHFTLSEFCRSNTATRLGLTNNPTTPQQMQAMEALCKNILEPLRQHIGKPLRINSGFRSPKVNKAIGGAKDSQHMKGEAADIECDFLQNDELVAVITELELPFDQLILEHCDPNVPFSGWVHVSHSLYNRKQTLTINESNQPHPGIQVPLPGALQQ